ncbi:hypothetical protein [Salinimicrobium terrae]|nr:hypothetical protein [Salinimicrobium terrae]
MNPFSGGVPGASGAKTFQIITGFTGSEKKVQTKEEASKMPFLIVRF